ncbi:MAG: hypothetical protein [Bacteriophage sp.]|nr:MAG: hypothetical protein [Bacteriophage sp.]
MKYKGKTVFINRAGNAWAFGFYLKTDTTKRARYYIGTAETRDAAVKCARLLLAKFNELYKMTQGRPLSVQRIYSGAGLPEKFYDVFLLFCLSK